MLNFHMKKRSLNKASQELFIEKSQQIHEIFMTVAQLESVCFVKKKIVSVLQKVRKTKGG